jgi:hypothetical protein
LPTSILIFSLSYHSFPFAFPVHPLGLYPAISGSN